MKKSILYFLAMLALVSAPLVDVLARASHGDWYFREEWGGTQYSAYAANSHHGTMKSPIVFMLDDNRPYKIIENNHVVIIKNDEKYDIVGKKLQ